MPRLICCECDCHFNSIDFAPICPSCQDAETDSLETITDYIPPYVGRGKKK